MANKKNVIILASGGVDSTACINYYKKMGFQIKAIFIDYSQKACYNELLSIRKIVSHYNIELEILFVNTAITFPSGEIKGRNAMFVIMALLANPTFQGIIALGIHSGGNYYDNTPAFVNHINEILIGYCDSRVLLDAPFIDWDKQMVFQYCKEENVPIHLTYSCEIGEKQPCGRCLSCKDRTMLNVS